MWRNWQTRRSQKPVMVTSWRFKSSHPHHDFRASCKRLALFVGTFVCGFAAPRCGKALPYREVSFPVYRRGYASTPLWRRGMFTAIISCANTLRVRILIHNVVGQRELFAAFKGRTFLKHQSAVFQEARFSFPPITTPTAPINGPRNTTHIGCLALSLASFWETFPIRTS
jgi:hypothetical protein